AFSQQGSELAETWPATPMLAYPDKGRFLMNQSEVSVTAEPIQETTDDTGSFSTEEEGVERRTNLPPFTKLPVSRKDFADTASSMARSSRYKVLLHETWIQPVGSKGSALPLIIDRSGDTGEWPLLQGSIKLWLSRYLHLETNLWLNTSGSYLEGDWRMPSAPLGPRAVANGSGTSLFAAEQTVAAPAPQPSENANLYWEEDQTVTTIDRGYPYRHAVALQQKRRMRSKEVHYIDHPMLGLMIKLTPLKTSAD
ncbi:MAG: CsiV family protein, partial [Pseudomonadales bacterium]